MQKITPPSKDELEDLLFRKMWTKKKVQEYYKVCMPVLSRWMKQYDLTYKITPKMQAKKREMTNKLKPPKFNTLLKKALKGEKVKVKGFNSDFLEEYLVDQEFITEATE